MYVPYMGAAKLHSIPSYFLLHDFLSCATLTPQLPQIIRVHHHKDPMDPLAILPAGTGASGDVSNPLLEYICGTSPVSTGAWHETSILVTPLKSWRKCYIRNLSPKHQVKSRRRYNGSRTPEEEKQELHPEAYKEEECEDSQDQEVWVSADCTELVCSQLFACQRKLLIDIAPM